MFNIIWDLGNHKMRMRRYLGVWGLIPIALLWEKGGVKDQNYLNLMINMLIAKKYESFSRTCVVSSWDLCNPIYIIMCWGGILVLKSCGLYQDYKLMVCISRDLWFVSSHYYSHRWYPMRWISWTGDGLVNYIKQWS